MHLLISDCIVNISVLKQTYAYWLNINLLKVLLCFCCCEFQRFVGELCLTNATGWQALDSMVSDVFRVSSVSVNSSARSCSTLGFKFSSLKPQLHVIKLSYWSFSLAYADMAQPLHRGVRCCVEGSETTFKLVYRAAVDDVRHGLGGSTDAQWVVGITPLMGTGCTSAST